MFPKIQTVAEYRVRISRAVELFLSSEFEFRGTKSQPELAVAIIFSREVGKEQPQPKIEMSDEYYRRLCCWSHYSYSHTAVVVTLERYS